MSNYQQHVIIQEVPTIESGRSPGPSDTPESRPIRHTVSVDFEAMSQVGYLFFERLSCICD